MSANRTYKDSVFSRYLSNPKRLVEVYNALEGTNYPPDTPVTINTLQDVLYKGRINDLSFLLDGQVLVLIEHQSTINCNMAIRLLLYVARLYEKLVKNDVIYRERPVAIPPPKFVVLYNGKAALPEYQVQRLSDAYQFPQGNRQERVYLELEVDIYNINYETKSKLLQESKSLEEYSFFIHQVREEKRENVPLEEAIQRAIAYCIQHDIMKEFLEENGSEVENMLYTEWDWDKALDIAKEESYKDGQKEGERRGEERGRKEGERRGEKKKQEELICKFSKMLKPEEIAKTLEVPLEYVHSLLASEKKES